MKREYWIIGIVVAVLGYLIWKFRAKIPFLKSFIENAIPDTFIRKDSFGDVFWSKVNGVYTYTMQYGIIAGIPQSTDLSGFMNAWKT